MKKVLIIPLLGMGYEGITSVIYNYTNNMDKKGLKIDFITFYDNDREIIDRFKKNGQIYEIPKRKKKLLLYIKALYMILKNNYDVVNIHGNSGTMLIETILAKITGVKKIILHCHSTSCNHPIINKILTPIMKFMATDLIACSNASGNWLYKNNFLVLKNAIDLDRFRYNKFIRESYRNKLGLSKDFVIGHVGSFNESKNHKFLIDIFKEFHLLIPQSKLLLIGSGILMGKVKKKVEELGLESNVIFLEPRNDIEKLYQVMDCLIFPSKWEGLGMVLIEAQASALPCFASTAVPQEAKVTNLLQFISLDEDAKVWADKILEVKSDLRELKKDYIIDEIRSSGYDIKQNAQVLREIYIK